LLVEASHACYQKILALRAPVPEQAPAEQASAE
jgi:hypothetical protein